MVLSNMEKKLSEVEKNKFLDLVIAFARKPENEDFKLKLINELSEEYDIASIQNDVDYIKKVTMRLLKDAQIQGDPTVDYSWVKNEMVRNQLILDNFRMGSIYHKSRNRNHFELFYDFCCHAFFQLEELTNFYLHESRITIDDFVTSYNSISEEYKISADKLGSVLDATMNQKIHFVKNKFNSQIGVVFYTIKSLTGARNEGLHRNSVKIKSEEANDKLVRFLKGQNYHSVIHALRLMNQLYRLELEKKISIEI